MNNKMYTRIKKETNYILDKKCTIRELAKIMNVSKSTVHNDLHIRLKLLNNELYYKVKKILDYHTQIRHVRGGEATKMKYLDRRMIS